jgi:glutamine amidotransferase
MIVVLNLGLGNVASVLNMMRKVSDQKIVISSEESDLKQADRIILPGVGHFDEGMRKLNDSGLLPTLRKRALEDGIPVLGICLGMQLMGTSSEEGTEVGLGWVPAKFIRFRNYGKLKVPHMGWNTVSLNPECILLKEFSMPPRFYFVHSYHMDADAPGISVAKCHYGYDFGAILNYKNLFGVQFHPEKSHKYGMKLLNTFANFKLVA